MSVNIFKNNALTKIARGLKDSVVTITNNLLATKSGTALDAVQGKVLDDKIKKLNSSLTTIHTVKVVTSGVSSESFGGYYGAASIENPDNKQILIHSCYSSGSTAKLGFAYPSSTQSVVVNGMIKNGEYTVNYLLL